jgi:hypothetical protein
MFEPVLRLRKILSGSNFPSDPYDNFFNQKICPKIINNFIKNILPEPKYLNLYIILVYLKKNISICTLFWCAKTGFPLLWFKYLDSSLM